MKKLAADCKFARPASSKQIAAAEEQLGVRFPRDLRSLLRESNGVTGSYGLRLVWPLWRIVEGNLRFRSNETFRRLFMPFDPLLFFADAGNGDQFAFAIQAGVIRRSCVYSWNHEDDSRNWQAPSLATYMKWWLNGTIKLWVTAVPE